MSQPSEQPGVSGTEVEGRPGVTDVVKQAHRVRVGDLICYPPCVRRSAAPKHDLLRVTEVKDGFIYGTREHPHGWDEAVVFAVYPEQVRVNGVALVERSA